MLSFSLFRAVFSKCVCCFTIYAAPPVLHEYLISVELNFSHAAALNHLNTILNRTASPIGLNGSIQVSGINVTTGTGGNPLDKPPKRSFRITIKDWVTSGAKTAHIRHCLFFPSPVCSVNRGSFQCRCENLHRWSCDQCLKYGPCDAITNGSCGCITLLPPDGQYCQPANQQSELYRDLTSSKIFTAQHLHNCLSSLSIQTSPLVHRPHSLHPQPVRYLIKPWVGVWKIDNYNLICVSLWCFFQMQPKEPHSRTQQCPQWHRHLAVRGDPAPVSLLTGIH